MVTDERAGEPAQADRAWAGYHPRAAAPALVASLHVCAGPIDLRTASGRMICNI